MSRQREPPEMTDLSLLFVGQRAFIRVRYLLPGRCAIMLEIFTFLLATPTATLIIAYATAYFAIFLSDRNW